MSINQINAIEWRREKTFEEFMRVNQSRMKEHFDDEKEEKKHYEDDSGWVENKLAYTREQFEEGCAFIFDKASAEGCKHCEDCEWNDATPDAFGTGDSPTMYECTNQEASECPQVVENINWWFD
jgi:hypothetical protein